ncbi:MAG TPA: ParA family protein [Thermodesulfovibrionales bacterium]|nr:ParA family protein [Thermodesulfovibrionales bacterium]
MQIVSIANHKGGVGKTTSATNIAACWGEAGKRILLVDMDPQGSASMSFGITDNGDDLLHALQRSTGLPVASTQIKDVDMVPSGPNLALARQLFTGSLGKELLLRCIRQTQGDWDRILIDCPPSLGVLTATSLWASKHAVIPVETNYLALRGLNQMVEMVASIRKDHPGIEITAIIPCRAHPRRRIHQEILERLEELFPGRVAPAVRENVALAEAPGLGKPVILYAPRSHGAEDYRNVASWLSKHI